jgi:hypothetical protein
MIGEGLIMDSDKGLNKNSFWKIAFDAYLYLRALAVYFYLFAVNIAVILVVLAVVLAIALASVALPGFIPGTSDDARIAQSQAYWRDQARPFAIRVNSCSASEATCTLYIQNMDAKEPYTISANGLAVAGCQGNPKAEAFAAEETRTITVGNCTPGAIGAVYDLPVNITYLTQNKRQLKQQGAENLLNKYV